MKEYKLIYKDGIDECIYAYSNTEAIKYGEISAKERNTIFIGLI